MRKWISLLVVAFLLVGIAVGCGAKQTTETSKSTAVQVPGVTDNGIAVGVVYDASGASAGSEAPYIEGIRTYIKFVNDNGGVNGRKIELKTEDDGMKVDKHVAGFRKILQEGVFIFAGQAGSSQFAAIDPEIKEEKVPVWGPYQTTALQSKNPYTFNTNIGYDAVAKIWLKRAKDLQGSKSEKAKVSLFLYQGASAIELRDFIKNFAPGYNVEVVQEEMIPGSATELAAQITKLKEVRGDYVFFLGSPNLYTTYLRDAQRLGASNIPVLAYTNGVAPVIYETVGKDASLNFFALGSFQPYNDSVGHKELKAVAEKYNVPAAIYSSLTYTQAWTSTRLLVEALKLAGKDLTREGFIKAAESIQNYDTQGLTSGTISFDLGKHDGITGGAFYSYDFGAKVIIPVSNSYSAD